jgi:hypothetical protein
MKLCIVGQHTEKPLLVKYKKINIFGHLLGGLQNHYLSNWAAQCFPALPTPKVLGSFQEEFISGSITSR